MRKLLLCLCLSLLAAGCGDKKPQAVNAIEDAAAKKAKSIENFAKDRIQVKE